MTTSRSHGAAVIGGGIAGMSVAAELAAAGVDGRCCSRARTSSPATPPGARPRATSPATARATRALIAASKDRFAALADEAGHAFLRPRPVLHSPTTAEEERLLREEVLPLGPVIELTPDEALRRWPALRPERSGPRRSSRTPWTPTRSACTSTTGSGSGRSAARSAPGRRVVGLERCGTGWRVAVGRAATRSTPTSSSSRPGPGPTGSSPSPARRPSGLTAYRRTIAIVRIPPGAPVDRDDPFAVSAGDHWYAKPEGQHLLVSPSEETPQEPGDARPDELDVALALERVNAVTTLGLRSVVTTWAGQRTFAPDRALVVGDRPEHPGLHVFAGQGGSGIETAPAAAALAASVILGDETPADLRRHGVRAADYGVRRIL